MKSALYLTVVLALLVPSISAWGSSNKERVRLEDVSAVTLTEGKMTTGRRSSPVPQLRCVGGTAGCHAFQPKTVQCINRGSDGYDVQWECKAEMDSAYQFGKIQVSCEGYDYPDDPFILRGSCGLEYELDLTEEGYNQRRQGGGHYRDDHYHHQPPQYHYDYGSSGGFSFRKIITYIIAGCVIYWALKCCCSGPRLGTSSYSSSSSSYSGTGSSYGSGSGSGSGPGFWSGAATGGALGYLFGSRGNRGYGSSWGGYGSSYRRPYSGGGWGSSGWSSGGWGGSGGSRRSSGSSSRTTSGFGGTSRR